MPYAARYVHNDANNDIDVTINYTLDNYMNIIGNVNNVYYAKTGYLIDPDIISKIDVKDENGNTPQDLNGNIINMEYLIGNADGTVQGLNEDEAEEFCLSGRYKIELEINCKSSTNSTVDKLSIVSNPRSLDSGDVFNISGARENEIQSQLKADYSNWHDNSYGRGDAVNAAKLLNRIQTEEAELANMRAVAYYVRNVIFSRWVYNNLKDIQACDIQNTIINNTVSQYLSSIGNDYSNKTASVDTLFKVFDGDTSKIFGNRNQDTDLESPFTNHKDGVIRNSIQYNLDLAFSAYTKMYSGYLTFQMPVISDSEWGRIINNVSIVSFMQGMPCGTKNFSSYSIVNSTNNELTVIPSDIYYVPTYMFNNQSAEVHRVDCEDFSVYNNSISYNAACSKYISVKSNNMKYDGIYNKNKSMYEYSFRNLLDYSCIINKNLRESNYLIGGTNDRVQRLDPREWSGDENSFRREAYYTGIAEQRQKIYKTNALTTSSGYTYSFLDNTGTDSHFSTTGENNNYITFNLPEGKSLKDIKEFEIYLKSFEVTNSGAIPIEIHAEDDSTNSVSVPLELYSRDGGYDTWERRRQYHTLSLTNGTNLTIRARCHCTKDTDSSSIKLRIIENETNLWVSGDCLGVKVIYK